MQYISQIHGSDIDGIYAIAPCGRRVDQDDEPASNTRTHT